jgi:ribose transport system substrate-binding protein
MRTRQKINIIFSVIISLMLITSFPALAVDYAKPVALDKGAQASFDQIKQKNPKTLRVAYMPPATEFNYYIAIGEGIKDLAGKTGVDTFMLAPQSGADINGQMGMLQDVISQKVDAIIISTHDENAAAPLLKRAVNQGIVVAIVNSDIPNFPTTIHAVVGYSQRKGTYKIGQYALKLAAGKALKVGVIEGQPGYHSTERVGGFLDAIKGSDFKVVTSLDGKWNVEGGNAAGMDALQAHPEIDIIFAANVLGNDGDTAGLEAIYEGRVSATVDTTPFVMGQIALQVVLDIFEKSFQGGFVETPTTIVDKANVRGVLQHPEKLYPKPSKKY